MLSPGQWRNSHPVTWRQASHHHNRNLATLSPFCTLLWRSRLSLALVFTVLRQSCLIFVPESPSVCLLHPRLAWLCFASFAGPACCPSLPGASLYTEKHFLVYSSALLELPGPVSVATGKHWGWGWFLKASCFCLALHFHHLHFKSKQNIDSVNRADEPVGWG